MKRLVFIAAVCLVPFVALVWWGLSASAPEPPAVSAPAPVVVPSVAVVAAPAADPAAPARAAPVALGAVAQTEDVDEPPPAPATAPAPIVVEQNEQVIKAVVDQLNPVVNNCFHEMKDRLRHKVRLATMFDTNPDGSLTHVRVKMKAADPYLLACVQDAIEGAHLDPKKGLPSAAMRHTFAYPPEDRK